MGDIYDKYQEADGMVYLQYASENAFGSDQWEWERIRFRPVRTPLAVQTSENAFGCSDQWERLRLFRPVRTPLALAK
jgi:hypothetical protein